MDTQNGRPHGRVHGVIAAVITPFQDAGAPRSSDGSIDRAVLERHLRYLVDAGVHGLFLGGTAGEGAFLSAAERATLVRIAREVVGAEMPIYVAFIRADTGSVLREMEELDRQTDHAPVDFVSATAPLYYPVDQRGLCAHFTAIADCAPAPLILYNIPANTHNALTFAAIDELSRHPRIAGIKESSGDFSLLSRGILEGSSDALAAGATDAASFAWIQGKDVHDGPSLLLGAPAIITGLGNVAIEPYLRLYDAALRADRDGVARAQAVINRISEALRTAAGAESAGPIPMMKAVAAARWGTDGRTRIAVGRTSAEVVSKTRRCIDLDVEALMNDRVDQRPTQS